MSDLVVADVEKRLGENQVLKGVSFRLHRGEVVALLGPSGSGKTTLLRAIAGLDHPDAGRIALGEDVLFDARSGTRVPPERRSLGLVFQSYALWPHRTVFENVAYGLQMRKVPAAEIRRRVDAILATLGLEAMAERHPHQLSGGQQQRVALARAVVYDPRVLLLDEPLSNLDAKLREEARAWLRQVIERLGISAICVTHDQLEALAIADRVVLLDAGRVEQEGTPQEMYREPTTLFAAEFLGTNNRFQGAIRETRGGLARIGGPGWELWGALRGEIAVGEAATAVIRLERCTASDGPGENVLPARVETALFLGERWEFVLRAGEARFRARFTGAPEERAYWVHFPPEALWLFPGAPAVTRRVTGLGRVPGGVQT